MRCDCSHWMNSIMAKIVCQTIFYIHFAISWIKLWMKNNSFIGQKEKKWKDNQMCKQSNSIECLCKDENHKYTVFFFLLHIFMTQNSYKTSHAKCWSACMFLSPVFVCVAGMMYECMSTWYVRVQSKRALLLHYVMRLIYVNQTVIHCKCLFVFFILYKYFVSRKSKEYIMESIHSFIHSVRQLVS